jgi:hypothetical protein
MPNFQDIFKSDTTRGVALGVGAVVVAVAAIPVIVHIGRPFARVALKSGLLLLEKSREAIAEAGENIEDLVAEVRAEMSADRESFVAAAAAAATAEAEEEAESQEAEG